MRKLKLLTAIFTLLLAGGLIQKANAQSWTGNEPAEGTFLLYNVGADKFINNGDPAQEWGTNAYLQAGFGMDIKFEPNGGAYNLNTNVSNGGSSKYLATSTWCDGAATPWTFEAVDGQDMTYTIKNGSSYLIANDAHNDVVYGELTGDNKSWWKLVSLDDFKTAMRAKAYSATDPMDVSVFIKGRSFARNDGRNSSWTTTHNGGNWTWIGASANKYYGNEAWNNTFSVSQKIENLPDGTYEVQCSGFGTNGTTYIFGNFTSKAIQSDNTTSRGTSKEAKWTAIHEDNAFAGQTTGTFTLSGGTLNLGLKRETNQGGDWCVYDEFRLYYYGLDLSEFAATLAAAVEAAEAVEGTVPTAAYNALAAVVTENNKTYTTAAEYTTAANAIVEATNTAKALQAGFARYNSIKTAAMAIASSINTANADNELAAATTNDGINAAIATLRTAFLAELPNLTIPAEPGYIDVTPVMVDNASVSQNTDFWTTANLSSSGGSAGVCNYGECEFYNRNFKFYQTLALTPGTWEFGVTGFHRAGNHKTYFYAGEDKILIPGVANTVVNTMAQAKDYFDAGNGKVALKFLVETAQNIEIGIDNQDTETDKWTIFRDFTLKYYGEPDYSVYEAQWAEAVAAAETALTTYAEYDALAAAEKATLTTAKADVPTPAGLKAGYIEKIGALTDATDTYVAACQKFESAKKAIADANAVKENHNFASAAAITTFADAIKAISDKYNAGTLTSEEAAAAGTTLGVAVTGWQANPNGAASVYLNDGFSLNAFTAPLYVNTWSVEGASDGTNFLVPFYENYGADANSLATNTFAGNVAGLDNGLYKVSVWVRARVKDNVELTKATGITINVNGGEAVSVTTGTQVGESRFLIGTFEAEGLVKNGNLNFNVNVLDGNNISWLSFKNVKYTKVRDLNPEEMLVAPTAITLMNGETAVTEPIALDAENLTVTLTPAYEPANASEGYVEWTTSDASVATVENGVVTAVSTGTATITATSTIDGEVSASATVNVTFPESVYASSQTIENDNDTRTTYTLGENIIKNGSFEYPTNPVFGWTTGTGSVNAMNAANFNIPTEGSFNGSQYLQANTSEGGAKEHSINTSWPIEKGKKYVFSFMIKADKQCTTDLGYIGVSLSNTKGSENANKKLETPAYGTEWQEIKHVFENPEEDGFAWLVFNCRWMANKQSFDNFYLCEVLSETTTDQVTEEEAAALLATVPTGKMNAEAQAALTAAQEAFEANKTIANYKALNAVIPAATASVAAYAKLGAAITKIDAALAAATTATASTADYVAVKTAYNEGTIADADIMTNVAAAYNAVIPVIKSQTAAQADFTLAIQNQSFEYGDMTGWSAVSSSDTGVRETSNATYAAAGSDGYYLFNTWWQGVPVSQTISDLPNGEYTLTASVASDGATVYLVANGEHNDGTETYAETNIEEKQYGKDTFQDATITFLVKQGSVTIAAVGGAGGDAGVHKGYVEEGYWWYKADNFRLVKNRDLTPEEEFVAADEADYEHLNGVLAKYALGFEAGEFAPYNNLTLVQAIAAAKAIDQTAVNSQESVQAAAEAITSAGGIANETEVNAVYDGTFAVAAANGAPAGWTMSNNTLGGDYHSRVFNGDERLSEFNETNSALFIRFDGTNSDRGSQYFYGNTEGYTMPLKANTYYRITVDFAGWGSTGKTLRMNLKGPDGFAKSQEYKHEHKADTESGYTPQQFNIVFQTGNTEGNYVIGFQCPGNDNNKHNAVISNLRLFTEPESSATLAVTDAKYGTFIAPFAVEIPNGVTAYTIESSNGNELVLTEVESDDIAANTPVVVFSENEVNEVFNGYSLAIKDSYTVGWLTGTYEDIDAPDGKYIMQKQNDKVGFYHVDYNYLAQEGMDKPKVRANRAYLTAPADAAGARAFFFDGGETTGISAIEALANGDAQIYNVNGVQQSRLTKGLNIIVTKDGKTHKVMVK